MTLEYPMYEACLLMNVVNRLSKELKTWMCKSLLYLELNVLSTFVHCHPNSSCFISFIIP